jgi:retinal rod rhodopsin-sensitive cGMP 3',5'-cyclic phosphodiesterase subunit delta
MNMRDANSGELMWESGLWTGKKMWDSEIKARIPREILRCRAVSREINFSSKEKMEGFRLEQRIFFDGTCIEEWFFDFGFVIPGSTNSWQQIIEAAGEDQMMAADALSGNLTIETSFYDGGNFIAKCLVRVFYT